MLEPQQIALQIGEKVREIATRQGNIPFRTGDLRKSVVVQPFGQAGAVVGSNLPYARAVHDGRPALVIRPKNGKMLKFKIGGKDVFARSVRQPARKGTPFLRNAVDGLRREGLGFLDKSVGQAVRAELEREIRGSRFFQMG